MTPLKKKLIELVHIKYRLCFISKLELAQPKLREGRSNEIILFMTILAVINDSH